MPFLSKKRQWCYLYHLLRGGATLSLPHNSLRSVWAVMVSHQVSQAWFYISRISRFTNRLRALKASRMSGEFVFLSRFVNRCSWLLQFTETCIIIPTVFVWVVCGSRFRDGFVCSFFNVVKSCSSWWRSIAGIYRSAQSSRNLLNLGQFALLRFHPGTGVGSGNWGNCKVVTLA